MSEEIKKEAVKKEDKIVVAPDKDTTKKKVSVELEVDTSVKDLGPIQPKLIHLARAVDSWRIFPRVFITTYNILVQQNLVHGITHHNGTT